ncbi:MAG: excinuclease ABC subunit UvrA [Chitinophagales bacterium]|nr:excinuclease ABC subunit UvrA [Chitinophagales bacterium]MDW8417964.1 excinuclease ABC subunit UvrA [Chitinophagales bacterium]
MTKDKKINFNIPNIGPQKIFIRGARVHNLKNVSLEIPKNKLVVVTGVSGSGKSSLTIDTLYAEGQRRYVESLSSYARQFMNRMDKPDVDYIKGLCPAIAIEQKVSGSSSRSTVGSLTEIYDYLRLLFARVGRTYSPVSGREVAKHEVRDVVDFVYALPQDAKVFICYTEPVKQSLPQALRLLLQKGFTRVLFEGEVFKIEDLLERGSVKDKTPDSLQVLVDRIVVNHTDEDQRMRVADSVQTAFREGHHECILCYTKPGGQPHTLAFSNRFEADGIAFEEPSPHFFNFNNPYGACKTCEGFGTVIGIDEDLVFPDKNLSVYEGAIAPWRGEKMVEWLRPLLIKGIYFDFPIHRPYCELTPAEKKLLWTGNEYFEGLNRFFEYLEEQSYKIQYRVMLSRYRGKTTCPDCGGSRIRKDAHYVKINGKSIAELLTMPIKELVPFFETLTLSDYEMAIAGKILTEIKNRLQTLMDVGLGYLTLNRQANTLSGGESQRIQLTRSIGSNLTSSMYILDEPSVGLHQRDTARLIQVLKNLRDLGNTVIVVEHDEDMMKASDHIIDVGPEAGCNGGEIMYNGEAANIIRADTLTARYLRGELTIAYSPKRRDPSNWIELTGCAQHNLKSIDVKIPLRALTVVSGVSGSGKTTLIKKIFYPALLQYLGEGGDKPGTYRELKGDLHLVKGVEMIDQNPLGRSSRSNPVTYVKAYEYIRDLFARMQLSKIRGYQPKDFSFNVEGGRCEACQGEGKVIVEMQFLADVHLKCEECNGRKFKEEILEVTYKGKNIYDVLEMSVDEALEFFADYSDIVARLSPLQKVGLGYIKLGQSSSTLSGGEAQRVKLASYLTRGSVQQPMLFIFDEPTTGLHFHDIRKLIDAFQQLIEAGHTVLVIEHHMDVIKCADWLIDLGPEGGDEGGYVVYQGVPEGILRVKNSYTGKYLLPKLHRQTANTKN